MPIKKAFSIISLLIVLSIVLVACGSSKETNATGGKTEEDSFPTKPIEMIVPYGAGGSTDQIARLIQRSVNDYLPNGQTIQIINEPGGAGVIGLTKVLNAKPDGYTIGLTASGAITNQPHYGSTSYTHDSFQPISRIATSPILLAVKSDSPWTTLDDLIEYIQKTRRNLPIHHQAQVIQQI